jgi:hypothetical protein
MKERLRSLWEKLLQPAKKDLNAVSECFELAGEGQVGFEKILPLFAEHNALASEVKQESTHGFLSDRVNLNGNLDPPGMLGPG